MAVADIAIGHHNQCCKYIENKYYTKNKGNTTSERHLKNNIENHIGDR